MRGNIGCPCSKCKGAGSLAPQLKAILEAFEIMFSCEIFVTSGYRCPEHNKAVGGAEKSRHMGDPALTDAQRLEAKEAYAADFWPMQDSEEIKKPCLLCRKPFTFREMVRPWFTYCYINRPNAQPGRWSIHGQIV